MKLEWMKEVDWEEELTDDLRLVLSVCGEDMLLRILARLSGHRLYISSAPVRAAQKKYVRKFAGRRSPQAIALEIGAPEGLVRRMLLEIENDNQD